MPRLIVDGQLVDDVVQVPESVAKCPECGGRLFAQAEAWDADTGELVESLVLDCEHEPDWDSDVEDHHRWWQGEWDPVRHQVDIWSAQHVRVETDAEAVSRRSAATDTAGQRTGREAAGGSEPPQASG